jgi:Wiskott-Aldrich syndrome protein
VGPSYAIPISSLEEKNKEDEKDKKLNLPGAAPRPIGTQERIVPLASHQTSRIPELAREALSVRHGFALPSFPFSFFIHFSMCFG